jgi:hypothetical protein
MLFVNIAPFPEIYVRLNRKGNKTAQFIQIKIGDHKIWTHPDETVDIALTVFYPPQDIFDYMSTN